MPEPATTNCITSAVECLIGVHRPSAISVENSKLNLGDPVQARIVLFGILASALSFLSACSTNPVTGKSELSLVSAQGEVSIGQQNYLPYQQQQGGAYVVDPELTLYVKQVGLALAKVSDRPGLPYDFVVLNNDVPNAWALPGGKIAINRGLLVHLEDEAQLAAVLGHEIVHAAARHGALQMTQKQVLGIGALAVGIAAQNTEYGAYAGLAAMGSAALYQARYGRQQELESDHYGIEYMVRTGYDPQAAVELQETFVRLSEGRSADFFSALFASHPPSQTRVEKNKARAAALPGGKRNREAYQRAIKQIIEDKPAYALHQEGLKAAAENNPSLALRKFEQAIAKQPDEALFYVSKGQIKLAGNEFKAAQTAFQQAYNRNPDYFMPALGLGLSQKAQSNYSPAKTNLERSLKLLPTPIAMYHLGELEERNGNAQTAAQYYQQVAQTGGNLGTAATERLQKMGFVQPTTK